MLPSPESPGSTRESGEVRYELWPGLLVKRWGESQAVVFHPATNSTHLVDACTGSMLAALMQAPGAGLHAIPTDASSQQVSDTLAALLQAGIVRPLFR